MKFLNNIFAVLSAAALLAACSGHQDDSALPVLKAGDTEIDLATESYTDFTVTFNGQDVTADSKIYASGTTRALPARFEPKEIGSYTFYAEYDGMQSNVVTVNVVNTEVRIDSKYEKHVSLIEFTGSWCTFCPAGYDRVVFVLSKPDMAKYKGRVHISAFHSGSDVMTIPQSDDIFSMFKGIEYPSFVSDLMFSGNLTQESIPYFEQSLVKSFEENSPHCGVAVSSSVDSGSKEATVTVKVASELTAEYRVVVIVVEDKVVGKQSFPTHTVDDHIHKHVARKVVTTYAVTFTGEKITDNGVIKEGEEASKSWTFAIDDEWNLGNTEIYALALDPRGHVNNMNVCAIDNGNADYNLKK